MVAHLIWDQGVAGSSPAAPTTSSFPMKNQFLLPPDFDAQMNVALENMDTSTPEGVKLFTIHMISTLYDQMVDLALAGASSAVEEAGFDVDFGGNISRPRH